MRPSRRRAPSILQLTALLAALVLPFALRAQTHSDSTHVTAQRINNDSIGAALAFGTSFCQTKTARSYPTMCKAFAAGTRRFIVSTAAESALVVSTVVVAPPAPTTTPTTTTTTPIDTGWTIAAKHDFEDGTFGPFTNPWGTDIDVIADPSNSGHGKVARMHYAGSNQDRNRALQFEYGPGISLKQSLRFDGDLYLPMSITDTATTGAQRKLLYWQPDPASPYMAVIVHLFGTGVSTAYAIARPSGVQEVDGGCPSPGCFLARGVWHHVTLLITINSALGTSDGLFRLTIDGVVMSEKTGASWSDASWTAPPKLRYFLVGDQVNYSGTFDEVRYWDNVTFSVKR